MKIIFLDIDGVLNSRAYDRRRNWDEQTDIDETRLPVIKEIVDATGAKIVLSSTWRQHWDRDTKRCDEDGLYINKTFAKFGLTVFDKTPDLGITAVRKEEVLKWLKEADEEIESFVIIDDYRYGWGELSEHFVKTEPNFRLGIEKDHVERAIEILNKVSNQDKKIIKVSVLGDSISTYFDFTDFGYPVYFTEEQAYENGIDSVDDIWWKQVIDGIGGELCVNNSYSGSLVAKNFLSSGCSKERCAKLSSAGSPDIILIYMGTNDRGYGVLVDGDTLPESETFYGAYRIMLRQIKAKYPEAKIVCGTLLLEYIVSRGEKKQRSKLPYYAQEFNNAIKLAAENEGCLVADLAAYNLQYETLDYCHPTKEGHKTLAELWLKELKNLI